MGRDAAAIKVVARMFNLKFDTLWQRYEREKKRIIESADKEAKDIIADAADKLVNASLSENFDAFLDTAEGGK